MNDNSSNSFFRHPFVVVLGTLLAVLVVIMIAWRGYQFGQWLR